MFIYVNIIIKLTIDLRNKQVIKTDTRIIYVLVVLIRITNTIKQHCKYISI